MHSIFLSPASKTCICEMMAARSCTHTAELIHPATLVCSKSGNFNSTFVTLKILLRWDVNKIDVIKLSSKFVDWSRLTNFGFTVDSLGGVYMRKVAPARVSYRHDFLISYRVYMMTGSFHISLFEGTLHVDKMHVWFKSRTLRMRYPFQTTGRPISHRNG